MSVVANGNGAAASNSFDHEKQNGNGAAAANGDGYYGGSGFQGGRGMTRTLTPGGHLANDDLIAIGSSHRRIANPLPMGALSFATTTMILSLYNLNVVGIKVPNVIVGFALAYGGTSQYLAGLWEFASGNTLGATIFVAYGAFWWGFSMIFIPFFGLMGEYNGQPGAYSAMGMYAEEAESAIGIFLWIWFGITVTLTFAAARSSITLITLLVVLDLTFAMLGAFYYTGNKHFETAGGALGVVTAAIAYYLAAGSFLVPSTSYFCLPLGSLAPKED